MKEERFSGSRARCRKGNEKRTGVLAKKRNGLLEKEEGCKVSREKAPQAVERRYCGGQRKDRWPISSVRALKTLRETGPPEKRARPNQSTKMADCKRKKQSSKRVRQFKNARRKKRRKQDVSAKSCPYAQWKC